MAGLGVNDSHVLPVVGKLLATAKTDKVRSRQRCRAGTRLPFATGNEWRAFFMTTTKDAGPGELEQLDYHRTPLRMGNPLPPFTLAHPFRKERGMDGTRKYGARMGARGGLNHQSSKIDQVGMGISLGRNHVPYWLGGD